MRDNFYWMKKDILGKKDKSSKKSWDKHILKLCEKINSKKEFFTTSSCSGRIYLVKDVDEKAEGNLLKVWHDEIRLEELIKAIDELMRKNNLGKNINIKFKQESLILHVVCESLNDAQNFLDKGKLAGWKRCGIISSRKRFIVELCSTEKLEFPIIVNGKIIVNEEFLKIVVAKANENLKKGWGKIKKLEKII